MHHSLVGLMLENLECVHVSKALLEILSQGGEIEKFTLYQANKINENK